MTAKVLTKAQRAMLQAASAVRPRALRLDEKGQVRTANVLAVAGLVAVEHRDGWRWARLTPAGLAHLGIVVPDEDLAKLSDACASCGHRRLDHSSQKSVDLAMRHHGITLRHCGAGASAAAMASAAVREGSRARCLCSGFKLWVVSEAGAPGGAVGAATTGGNSGVSGVAGAGTAGSAGMLTTGVSPGGVGVPVVSPGGVGVPGVSPGGTAVAGRHIPLETHTLKDDPPHELSSVSRRTCTVCGSSVLITGGRGYGSAVEQTCEQMLESNRRFRDRNEHRQGERP